MDDWLTRLRALREEAGLTQTGLAERLGVDSSYVSRMERGERRLDLRMLTRWLEACGYRLMLAHKRHDALALAAGRLSARRVELLLTLARLLVDLSEDNLHVLEDLVEGWVRRRGLPTEEGWAGEDAKIV